MRHNKKFNHLGRTSAHRKALLSNMSAALIMQKRIFTTLAKAKALRKHIEPIITRSKINSGHNRRLIFSRLQNAEAVTELFEVVASKVLERPGGYIRIIRTGYRKGDDAAMCMIELVDFNDVYVKDPKVKDKDKPKSKTRRQDKKKGKSETRRQDKKSVAKTAQESDITKLSQEADSSLKKVDLNSADSKSED